MTRHDTILLACGNAENRKLLRSLLSESYNLLEAVNTKQAMLLLEQNIHCIAAIVLDITVPKHLNKALLQSEGSAALLEKVPVIIITPDDSPEVLGIAFSYGAADAIPLYYDPYAMLHRIENIVDLHLHKQQLEQMVEEQANALRQSNDTIVEALSSIIEYRSVESGQHILRIRRFTQILLEELALFCPEYGLNEGQIRIISSASALHDVGKIAIPDSVLMKPGPLTEEERELMKTHPVTGCRILESLGNAGNPEYLRYAHNICHYHHERWDGAGYPEGLSGDDIPICAQVVGLADVYDALTSRRVYKEAYPYEEAVNMILKGACGVFSPKLLECFKHIAPKYEALSRAYADGLAPESENFDTQLPSITPPNENDSMARTWAKYQALVHYANAFLLELDMDNSLFHLIYNPFPELVDLSQITNFAQLEALILDSLVVPQERERMYALLHRGINAFLKNQLRRVTHTFRFRSKRHPSGERFELTLLRINPMDSKRNTLAVLCRKAPVSSAAPVPAQRTIVDPALFQITESAYRCRYDRDFTLLELKNEAAGLAGYHRQELQELFGDRLIELVLPEDREYLRRQFLEQLSSSTAVQLEYQVLHKSGRVLWVLNRSRLVIDPDGMETLHSYIIDITATKTALTQLQEKVDRYEIILAQTENVLFEWDIATDTVSFSDTWKKIFGFSPSPEHFRKSLREGAFFHPDDLPLLFDKISDLEQGSAYETVEVRMVTANGRYLWRRFRASAIRDADGVLKKIVGIIINIDAEKQAAQVLQDRAERDQLTKLLNKNAGRKRAEEYFHQFPTCPNCALLIIDLDDFKLVNDRYGHLFGDTVLSAVAKEIKKLFRSQDILARIGGDEFMVLMRGISDRSLVSNRCSRLLEILHNLFRKQYRQLPLGCSIGIALAPEHGSSYFDLFRCADLALYQTKNQGKNSYSFYDSKQLLRQAMPAVTAVNNHIDSDEQPGLADGSLVQFAFQRLYTSEDVDAAINDILDMVGRQTNVSRVYIFENSPDNRFCSNTYEWCNEGIPSERENLQNISYETDIPDYEDNFNEAGIFYCPDIEELPQKTYDIVAPQGIKSMLHCAIRDKGVFRGYIGFDDCVTKHFWTKEQIQVLTYFSEMLSVFLLKKQAQERTAQRLSDLSSILDNQNAWIYIIDTNNYTLKYINAKTRTLAPDVAPGMLCHKAFFGLDAPCENCPAKNIRSCKTACASIHNPKFQVDTLAEATLIQWDDQESCLLTVRNLNDTQQIPSSTK